MFLTPGPPRRRRSSGRWSQRRRTAGRSEACYRYVPDPWTPRAQEIKRAVVTKEKDGRAQPTSELAEAVTAAQVAEAVQKQKRVDLAEQLLFMDPIAEIGGAHSIS